MNNMNVVVVVMPIKLYYYHQHYIESDFRIWFILFRYFILKHRKIKKRNRLTSEPKHDEHQIHTLFIFQHQLIHSAVMYSDACKTVYFSFEKC